MCICLNCQYINNCKQYFFIETNHLESHLNKYPMFLPSQSITIVKFFYLKELLEFEWDIIECLSFKEKPGNWLNFIDKTVIKK